MDPRVAFEMDYLVVLPLKRCTLKEEVVFVLVFHDKSSWSSEIWLDVELNVVPQSFGAIAALHFLVDASFLEYGFLR